MKNYRKKILAAALSTIVIYSLGLNSSSAVTEDIPLKNDHIVPVSMELRGGINIDKEDQIVTLNLIDSDIRHVLRMLADKSKLNIVLDDSVTGLTTLDLVDVTVNKAFEYIMTLHNLQYLKDGNTLIIATKDKATELGLNKLEIKPIKIKYVSSQKVADFLNQNIFSLNNPSLSGDSIVVSNPATNEILVFGDKNDFAMAEKMINHLDVKPQVSNFTVNFANPQAIATKICWAVFNATGGTVDAGGEADQEEGSESALVCGNTEGEEASGSGDLASIATPSYWVLADTGLSQITVYGGTEEQLLMAKEIINNFDKKEPQVYLETSIIELSESGSKSLQSMLYATSPKQSLKLSDGVTRLEFGSEDTNPLLVGVEPVYQIFDTYSNFRAYMGAINYVLQQQKGRVIANPRIIAANNTRSEIDISSDIIASTEITTDGDTNEQRVTINVSDEAGIKLSILPKISPNGYVTLTIEPSYNSIKERVLNGSTVSATLLNRREFKAKNIRVKSGETLVIGGLIQETETNTQNKTPILGDIPIIGTLFKNQATIKERSELILMITPRIIEDNDEETKESI